MLRAWIHAADVYLIGLDDKSQYRLASLRVHMRLLPCTKGADDYTSVILNHAHTKNCNRSKRVNPLGSIGARGGLVRASEGPSRTARS